ncbi:2-oxo acid dehydrogenase subunit E2 [Aromatoleum evansii]|uniref:2-oxo acid dehydrogenase subunit E2 n=1 Tax=Aromatoleum evansii TaxID=59406 RepID=UPI00145DC66F|nr:2-oxo acid dehydrogenase subunit E2 [Aromatoleum evansii]NMG30297.1 dehydrogenase [Aromatoleum evansii]
MPNTPDYLKAPSGKFSDANVAIVEYEAKRIVGVNFFAEIDLTEIESIRTRTRAIPGRRATPYTAFVVKATAMALADFPYANARLFPRFPQLLLGTSTVRFSRCDMAVAVERSEPGMEGTAFCDILRSANEQSLDEISDWLQILSTATPENNKQWNEFSNAIRRLPRWLSALAIRLPCFFPSLWVKYRGGAAVVSSPAKYGVDAIGATWVWPVGVSFGLVKQRAVVRDSQIVACPTFILTLSFDRRMIAGAQAARFFRRIVDILEGAEDMLLP